MIKYTKLFAYKKQGIFPLGSFLKWRAFRSLFTQRLLLKLDNRLQDFEAVKKVKKGNLDLLINVEILRRNPYTWIWQNLWRNRRGDKRLGEIPSLKL